MKIVILGFGMQGKATFHDLLSYPKVEKIIIADISDTTPQFTNLNTDKKLIYKTLDLNDESKLLELIKGADIVIDALPGTFAIKIAKIAIKAGVNLVSSMYYLNPSEKNPETLFQKRNELKRLNDEAISKNITVLPEFGLDPGIDLVLGAKALSEFEEVELYNSYGFGIPAIEHANNPLKYKFTWSIPGLLTSYRRPAKIISNGQVKEIDGTEIFSPKNRHILKIDGLTTPLESFPNGNSAYYADLFGINGSVKDMGRYVCRWPGHCDFWYALVKSGFLNDMPVRIGTANISPINYLASLLDSQEQFHYKKDELDMAIVRAEVIGKSFNIKKKVIYQLIDYKDLTTGFTAMQRTVGFTMGLGARLILDGRLNKKGLISPIDVPFDLLSEGLKQYGMGISRQEIIIK